MLSILTMYCIDNYSMYGNSDGQVLCRKHWLSMTVRRGRREGDFISLNLAITA